MKKLILLVPAIGILFAYLASAQQIPSQLSYVSPPSTVVAGLPSPSSSPTPGTLYEVTDDTTTNCAFGTAPTGSGSTLCTVYFDGSTLAWVHAFPPDITPPTTINVLTGTGGGYTNCVSGGTTTGCATGQALWVVNAGTTSGSTYNVSGTFVDQVGVSHNLTTWGGSGVAGWNYDIWQTNGTYSNVSNLPQYNGCHASGTIASVTNSTTFVANAPTSKTGSNCSTNLFTSTTATVTIWDGKDDAAIYACAQAAGALATTFNSGAECYIPSGFYHLQTDNAGGETNRLPSNVKMQGQSPTTTFLVQTDTSSNINNQFMTGNHSIITGFTFTGTNTSANQDYAGSRGGNNQAITLVGNDALISGNVFQYFWGDGVVESLGGSPSGTAPCAPGTAPNSAGACQPEPTNMEITNNYFAHCADRGYQLSAGHGVRFENNQMLDCDVAYGFNITTNSQAALFSDNTINNNDLRCDSVGSGLFVATAAISSNPQAHAGDGNGCWVNANDDGNNSLNLSQSSIYANHMRADTSGVPAACWWGSAGTSVKPNIKGNTCTTGEHCSNNGSSC